LLEKVGHSFLRSVGLNLGLRTPSGYILDQAALSAVASSTSLLLEDDVDIIDASGFWEKRVGLAFKVEVSSGFLTYSAAGSSSLRTTLGEDVISTSTSTMPDK